MINLRKTGLIAVLKNHTKIQIFRHIAGNIG